MDSSRALPTGVVTFLLTDIEGSTRRWESEPDAMREALVRHDAMVTAYVRKLNGHVVKSKGEGDSVFAVFNHARDAVSAALVLQVALNAETWPTSTPIRVRMAIHTGQVELRDGDYYGPTVNRCARLRALATGGQVLVSGVTAQLTQTQLPAGASLKDLGTHQLKDLSAPERVWQLSHERMVPTEATTTPTLARSAASAASGSSYRAYKLTDHLNHTGDGRVWGERVKHVATGISDDDVDGAIRCYATPNIAALLNALEERYRLPRLWEAVVDREPKPGRATVDSHEVTTLQQVAMPNLTGVHHARFALLCAQAACENGAHKRQFNDWAAGWLAGQDSSGVSARELADAFEDEAQRGSALAMPEELMLANAAGRRRTRRSCHGWPGGRVTRRTRVQSTARRRRFAPQCAWRGWTWWSWQSRRYPEWRRRRRVDPSVGRSASRRCVYSNRCRRSSGVEHDTCNIGAVSSNLTVGSCPQA